MGINNWLILPFAFMELVTLHNKSFSPYISYDTIVASIRALAQRINDDYEGKQLLFVGVLNGSFRFVSELMQFIELPCEVSFIKMASYEGTESKGHVNQLIGFNEPVEGKHIIILEDIVDTGNTLVKIMGEMDKMKPSSVRIATLLYKPEAYTKNIPVDYVGLEIPNEFIVGFGLDYDGLGRNLNSIYKIESKK